MQHLHTHIAQSADKVSDCQFGMKYLNAFFADDGFGNYISFGNATLHQLFASTNDILTITNSEIEREATAIPDII